MLAQRTAGLLREREANEKGPRDAPAVHLALLEVAGAGLGAAINRKREGGFGRLFSCGCGCPSRRPIAGEAQPGEADQHHRPGRGLGDWGADLDRERVRVRILPETPTFRISS